MITNRIQLNTIEEAIEDIRQGKIIIVDDEDRETKVIFGSSRKVTQK
jgi:3,4-dihydroxy 2-butanone 4-phosphate synthase/GTP cyclohydrolase II